MSENFRVQLRHPVLVFIVSLSLLLIGCSVGGHWHLSKGELMFIVFSGAILGVIHEVCYGFLWISLTAWWIGTRRRSNDDSGGRDPFLW